MPLSPSPFQNWFYWLLLPCLLLDCWMFTVIIVYLSLPCEFRNKRNIWMLHGLKRVLSSDTLIWCLSGIYLTVKSTLCLWFKAVCTDPISFYTKEMQRLEMDCSVFTEANRSVFSPPAIYFLAALVLAYIFFFFLFEGIFTPEATCLWFCCMEGY